MNINFNTFVEKQCISENSLTSLRFEEASIIADDAPHLPVNNPLKLSLNGKHDFYLYNPILENDLLYHDIVKDENIKKLGNNLPLKKTSLILSNDIKANSYVVLPLNECIVGSSYNNNNIITIGKVAKHLNEWTEMFNDLNISTNSYEDMIKDMKSIITKSKAKNKQIIEEFLYAFDRNEDLVEKYLLEAFSLESNNTFLESFSSITKKQNIYWINCKSMLIKESLYENFIDYVKAST